MKRSALILSGIMLSVLGVVFMVTFLMKAEHQKSLQIPEYFNIPEFTLVSGSGGSFSHTDMIGKISIVDFIFTSCMGPCPVMSAKMKYLYDEFADNLDVQFVSISVDPIRDTEPVLRDYAERFSVTDNRWKFLRDDDIENIASIIEDGFKLAADDLPFNHPIQFVLVDEFGIIRGYYNGTEDSDIDSLRSHIYRFSDF